MTEDAQNSLDLVADIVSAYVSNNTIAAADVPALIASVHGALNQVAAGKVEEQPHAYTNGQYLRIEDPAGGKGVLVFETDGKDAASKVLRWRIGVAPQVDYVEGCS